MKFIHTADVHLGGWRDPKLSAIGMQAFEKLIDHTIEEKADFLIIAGDLFNTALPGIDIIKETVTQLQRLRIAQIPTYIIPGSHDYSPSGKTMLAVLEQADLVVNVFKKDLLENDRIKLLFTTDQKTGAKLTGLLGKKNMLEKSYYESLDTSNLNEPGFKIFLFHTALEELKTKEMQNMVSSSVSLLPKGFDYYAGGHVHIVEHKSLDGYKNIVYPGPLFPNSFSELEKLECGGYYLYHDEKIEHKKIRIKHTAKIHIDCNEKTPEEVTELLQKEVKFKDVTDRIVLLRIAGKLRLGKILDIELRDIVKQLYEKGAYAVLKNTVGIHSGDFEEVKKKFDADTLETEVIDEHLGQILVEGQDPKQEKELILKLLNHLAKEKEEGETNATYEERLLKDIDFVN